MRAEGFSEPRARLEVYMQLLVNCIIFFVKWIFIILSPFILSTLYFVIVNLIKGKRFIKREFPLPKKENFFIRLFIEFPKRFADDLFVKNPNYFTDYGVHVVEGMQGSGKTTTVAWLLRDYKKRFPKIVIKTNFFYKAENSQIKSAYDLMTFTNGEYGEIDVVDECQNWFNSAASKDFPIELIEQLTQQRKQRKMFIFTTQCFTRLAKPIREQTYFLLKPICFFGCLVIVRKYQIKLKEDGTIDKQKLRKIWFYVQDDELRNSFDTYKIVKKLSKTKYVPRGEQITKYNTDRDINVTVNGK